jgi:hypothetical protein
MTSTSTASVNVAELLRDLLEAQQSDTLFFVAQADPYVTPGLGEARRRLRTTIDADQRRATELAGAIDNLGATIRPAPLSAELQYLAFLSMSFLLPKVAESRRQSIARYETAIARIGDASPAISEMLRRYLAELKEESARS